MECLKGKGKKHCTRLRKKYLNCFAKAYNKPLSNFVHMAAAARGNKKTNPTAQPILLLRGSWQEQLLGSQWPKGDVNPGRQGRMMGKSAWVFLASRRTHLVSVPNISP